MKVGVFSVILSSEPLEKALDFLVANGVEAIELGTGAWPGNAHCPIDSLLADHKKAEAFLKSIANRGIEISSLSCHGNPLPPDAAFAKAHHEVFRQTVQLAKILGVPRVTTFSGCPGDHNGAKYPNWVTCPWPDDFLKVLDWQWKEKVIPYWEGEVKNAEKSGIEQICFEMHPGFVVDNPEIWL